MSGEEPRRSLRFALGFIATQAILAALLSAVFVYFAFKYQFHFYEISDHRHSGRYAWVGDLADSNDGKMGVVIFSVCAIFCLWLASQAGWRFFTGRKAAALTERGLLLHRSYWRPGEIPYADVLSAEVGLEPFSGLIFKRHDLLIRFRDRKAVRLRALTTEGGREALEAFATELNARRTFAGGVDLTESGGDQRDSGRTA